MIIIIIQYVQRSYSTNNGLDDHDGRQSSKIFQPEVIIIIVIMHFEESLCSTKQFDEENKISIQNLLPIRLRNFTWRFDTLALR
jgi:hypothetical protein